MSASSTGGEPNHLLIERGFLHALDLLAQELGHRTDKHARGLAAYFRTIRERAVEPQESGVISLIDVRNIGDDGMENLVRSILHRPK